MNDKLGLSLSIIFPTLFNLLAFGLLVLMACVIFKDTGGSGASRGATLFLGVVFSGLLGNIHRFVSVKASLTGFEATLTEAEKVIAEAQVTVVALQELAVALGCFVVDAAEGAGRFAGPATEITKHRRKEDLAEQLRKLNLPSSMIERILKADQFWKSFDFMRPILQPSGNTSDRALDAWRQEFADIMNRGIPLSPEECEIFLRRHNIVDSSRNTNLRHYRYYLKHNRRPSSEIDLELG